MSAHKCCFLFDLNLGCTLVGAFEVFLSVLSWYLSVSFYWNDTFYHCGWLLSLLGITVGVVLIIACIKIWKYLMIPYIVYVVIRLFYSLAYVILSFVKWHRVFTTIGACFVIPTMFLYLYFFGVVSIYLKSLM